MFARITSRSWIRIPPYNLISKPVSSRTIHQNSSSTSNSETGNILFDQTKKNNDPDEEVTNEQLRNSKPAPAEKKGTDKHPAQEAEPEEPTSRSTGIKREGQENRAGEGENKDVHTEHRDNPGPNMTWGGK